MHSIIAGFVCIEFHMNNHQNNVGKIENLFAPKKFPFRNNLSQLKHLLPVVNVPVSIFTLHTNFQTWNFYMQRIIVNVQT